MGRMGRIENEIIATMKGLNGHHQPWDTSKLSEFIQLQGKRHFTGVRRTSRAINRTSVIPQTLSVDDFLNHCSNDMRKDEITNLIERSRRGRLQISIVQLTEVRLGVWALFWNNLRLARQWIWISGNADGPKNIDETTRRFLRVHNRASCLLFVPSAHTFLDQVLMHGSNRVIQSTREAVILEKAL